MSAKLLLGMREPAPIGLDFAEKIFRDEGAQDGRVSLDEVRLAGYIGIAFSLRDEEWSAEVERLKHIIRSAADLVWSDGAAALAILRAATARE